MQFSNREDFPTETRHKHKDEGNVFGNLEPRYTCTGYDLKMKLWDAGLFPVGNEKKVAQAISIPFKIL